MSQRIILIVFVVFLAAAVLLDVTGIAPGAGVQYIPLLILLGGAFLLWRSFKPGQAAQAASDLDLPAEADRARLDVKFGAGDLTVTADAPAGSLLRGHFLGAMSHTVQDADGVSAVTIRQPFSLGGLRRADWQMALSPAVTWEALRLTAASSTVRLDLADLTVSKMLLEVGATQLDATLPRAGEVTLHLSGGRSVLRVPPDADAEIVSEIRIGDVKVDESRFAAVEPSRQWGTLGAALRIRLKGGLGSVELLNGTR